MIGVCWCLPSCLPSNRVFPNSQNGHHNVNDSNAMRWFDSSSSIRPKSDHLVINENSLTDCCWSAFHLLALPATQVSEQWLKPTSMREIRAGALKRRWLQKGETNVTMYRSRDNRHKQCNIWLALMQTPVRLLAYSIGAIKMQRRHVNQGNPCPWSVYRQCVYTDSVALRSSFS